MNDRELECARAELARIRQDRIARNGEPRCSAAAVLRAAIASHKLAHDVWPDYLAPNPCISTDCTD